MKYFITLVAALALATSAQGQLYFPPNTSDAWDTLSPAGLGWCQTRIDSLYEFLESNNTKAFIVLKDGKIVLEQYFHGHTSASFWYWASAGKTLTAFMAGIAQQEGYLSITDTTSFYLGQGWTNCTSEQEEKITIWHQLTMTSGLDDGVTDPYCTEAPCLQYLGDAGTRWAYHNAPYTLLDQVIESATGQTLNQYTTQKVKNPCGMDGLFIQQDFNNVFFSTARSMARFGLLILNQGKWDDHPIMTDADYFNQMVNTSQELNESYGYLWWLNGKNSFMLPQTQFVFNGSLSPNAPADLIAALGKNGQFLNVVPSENLVLVRMGESPDNSLVPIIFHDEIWEYLKALSCNPTSISETEQEPAIKVFPNPADDLIHFNGSFPFSPLGYALINGSGQVIRKEEYQNPIDVSLLMPGIYFLKVFGQHSSRTIRFIKN